jgi:hypothetical protein
MSATVTKAGPYFSSGSISFSSLRSTFKESGSGSISASELRRNTIITDTNPIVPNATENASVSASSNLALSQFRNTIKYYYITQTGTDINFDIDSQSWNSNLNKNIKKWMYITGTCGSNSYLSPAAVFNSTAYNLTIAVSGGIYGAGGVGGTTAIVGGSYGGDALSITNTSGSNFVVNVESTANIYGGGGGGEKGANGSNGSGGTCTNYDEYQYCLPSTNQVCNIGTYERTYRLRCCEGSDDACRASLYRNVCVYYTSTSGGTGGSGGDGGPGRGYTNLSGSLLGVSGTAGTAGGGCGATDGTNGETGGSGGEWGNSGENTTNAGNGGVAGRAIAGSNYTVTGTINSNTIRGLYQ